MSYFLQPWTIHSMEFSRPENWSGWPLPDPGDLPSQRSNPGLPHCRWIFFFFLPAEPQGKSQQEKTSPMLLQHENIKIAYFYTYLKIYKIFKHTHLIENVFGIVCPVASESKILLCFLHLF